MDEVTVLIHQIQAGMGIVAVIEYLKSAGWFPWLQQNTDKLNRVASLSAALAVSLGIVITGDANSGWTIQVPPALVLLHAFGHFVGQAGFQHWFYKVAK